MPLPALIGLPALIAWFSSTFSAVVAWFFTKLSYKLVVLTAALVAMSAALLSLYDYFKGEVGKLIVSAPQELISASYILPSNLGTCITIILSAEAVCAVYSITMRMIKLKVEAVS